MALRLGLAIVLLGGVSAASPSSGLAAPAPVTLDSTAPTLSKTDSGFTLPLGFTNLTDSAVQVRVRPTASADTDCSITPDKPPILPAAQHSSLTLTLTNCDVVDQHVVLDVAADTGTGSPLTLGVTAAVPEEPTKPDWGALLAFPIALFGSGLFVLLILIFWRSLYFWRHGGTTVKPKGKRPRQLRFGDVAPLRPEDPLPGLPKTYDLKDSWVSNITGIVALFTGVFASTDLLKTSLGDNAEPSLALASAGAAVALAFTGAAPILVLATRRSTDDSLTAGGLLLGSVATLTGAFGGLWVAFKAGSGVDLGGLEDTALPVALVATATLLLIYGYRTLMATMEQGLEPPTSPPTEAVLVDKIVSAIKGIEPRAKPSARKRPSRKKPTPREEAVPTAALRGDLWREQASSKVLDEEALVAPGPSRSAVL